MAAAELRRGSLEPNRASGQARHALRRAHTSDDIKAAAGDANAIHNRNVAQAAEQQTRRCQFAAHGLQGEARLIFPAIALKSPWGRACCARPHGLLES